MILVKTDVGQQVLKDRSVPLTPRQRSAFILFDGKRSVDDVIAAGTGITAEEVGQMVESGLLAPLGGQPVAPETPPVTDAAKPVPSTGAPAGPPAASSSATRTHIPSPRNSPAASA